MTARQPKITPKVRIIRPYATYHRKIIKKLSRRLHEAPRDANLRLFLEMRAVA